MFSAAFHSQFEYFAQYQQQPPQNVSHYGQQPFDMGTLTGALPQQGQSSMSPSGQYGVADAPAAPSSTIYRMQQASPYPSGLGVPFDPAATARMQPQYPHYGSFAHQASMMPKQQHLNIQTQGHYAHFDPYGLGMSGAQVPQLDPRMAPQGPYGMAPGFSADLGGQFNRRASEPAPVPSFPRGPPRKPKQSGHALWVGNLPPSAQVGELKDHFSRDATKDIESLFLISKSNCAFVNYRSEAACIAAMNRFHDSRFHGVRLVCRLRRGAATGPSSSARSSAADISESASSNDSPAGRASPIVEGEPTSPTIVGSPLVPKTSNEATLGPPIIDGGQKAPEKYYVVKSLTVQDLEASVRNGIWATQSHNESTLNRAYEEADNVYLIFSANKSGEYFGYARMASIISGEPVNLSSSFTQAEPRSAGVPQSIPTPVTATAPKGRIIDDSARGTIFWEAEHSDDDREESPDKGNDESTDGQNWGRQFAIEWLSTARLPFYRTRGLRNPWNANREVWLPTHALENTKRAEKEVLNNIPSESFEFGFPLPSS